MKDASALYDHISMQSKYSKLKGTHLPPFLWLYGKTINYFQPYTFIAPIFFVLFLFVFLNSKNILEVNKSTPGLPK